MNAENVNFDIKEIIEISIEDIMPNRFQPRIIFDQKSLEELANSIRQHGIIQPLVVRKLSDKYEIIAGERRYKAAVLAGLKKLPCIVMNLNDNESAEVAIVENIQRKEMTPLEEALSYKKLLDKGYLTQDQLASRMGKSQPSIANKLRLLSLDDEVKDALMHEKISERHARSLLTLKSNEEQKQVLNQIIDNKLTVKQTDDLIRNNYTIENNKLNEDENEKIELKTNIPNPYKDNEPNPQLNMINKLNSINIINDNQKLEEQPENIINTEKPLEFDVNELKSNAVDINIPKESNVDFNSLLQQDTKPTVFAIDEKKVEEPKNRFIMNFDDDFKDIEVLDISEDELPKIKFEEDKKDSNIKTAINLIKENIETLKQNGFKASFEEFDFEKMYQIIIKIDK